MSTVFFLFLLHLSVGLVATLPFVPERAGAKYFKFCSGAAAFMTTSALWLLVRRFGWQAQPALVATTGAFLVAAILYNRARHFSWSRALTPLLAVSLVSGVAACFLGTGAPRALVAASDLSSALLLGAAAAAMILGHWYLVVLDLPITALRRLTLLLVAGLVVRSVVVGLALAWGDAGAYRDLAAVARGLWSPDGVFVWMRLLFGLVGPLSLIWFIWKTVEIRSTQSATGILYVQLFLVLAGELLAKYLRVAAGFAL